MNKSWTWTAVVFALALPTAVTWLYFVALADRPPAVRQSAYGAGKLVQFAFPLVWVVCIARRPVRLRRPQRADWLFGLGSGALIVAAMMGLYYGWLAHSEIFAAAVGPIREQIAGFGVDTPGKYAALAVFYALVHSLLEEYYWRWFVFGELRRVAPLWPAIAAASVGFAAHHVLLLGTYFGYDSPLAWLFAAAVAVGGALWAWMYQHTGSLWGPWLSHLLVDAGIFLVGWHAARDMLV